jgi:NADPH2:quinone reductase
VPWGRSGGPSGPRQEGRIALACVAVEQLIDPGLGEAVLDGHLALRYGDVPEPQPTAGEVLIRVEVVSLEGGDMWHRRSTPPSGQFHVGGYQATGVVEAVGDGVTSVRTGQRVVGHVSSGSHAELFVVPAPNVFAVPEGLDLEAAAAIPVTFGTASDALFEFGALQAGDTVLIQGAAGGVGIACVQLAQRAGARVIGTARGDDRLERLAALGMNEGIDYARDRIDERVQEITAGAGVDLVVDMAGGQSLPQLLTALVIAVVSQSLARRVAKHPCSRFWT